ncbi:hypothetical protein DERP_005382, partial [Dermatophagoides pteronyssinus]
LFALLLLLPGIFVPPPPFVNSGPDDDDGNCCIADPKRFINAEFVFIRFADDDDNVFDAANAKLRLFQNAPNAAALNAAADDDPLVFDDDDDGRVDFELDTLFFALELSAFMSITNLEHSSSSSESSFERSISTINFGSIELSSSSTINCGGEHDDDGGESLDLCRRFDDGDERDLSSETIESIDRFTDGVVIDLATKSPFLFRLNVIDDDDWDDEETDVFAIVERTL